MRTKLTKIALAAGITLALAFTLSCSMDDKEDGGSSSSIGTGPGSSSSGGGNGQGGAFNQNSQIYIEDCNYDYEPEEGEEYEPCQIVAYLENGTIEESGFDGSVGSVTNGIVNLQLPQTISEDILEDANYDDESCSEVTQGLKRYVASFRLYDDEGYYVGSLSIKNQGAGYFEYVDYWYFSKAGKIECNDENEYYTQIISINATKGWNKIYLKMTSDGEDFARYEASTSNILTNNVKWLVETYSPWF